MGVGKISSKGRTIVDLQSGNIKDFSRGGQKERNFNFPLESKKMTFFANNLIRKCQISQSRYPRPTPWLHFRRPCH